MNTKFFCNDSKAKPSIAKAGDAGIDLRYSGTKSFTLLPGCVYKIPTGTFVEIPQGKCGVVFERSGLGLKGVQILARVVDAGYRGEIFVVLGCNFNMMCDAQSGEVKNNDNVVFNPGDKIAQMVILDHHSVLEEVDEMSKLSSTERGATGFGSSDKK